MKSSVLNVLLRGNYPLKEIDNKSDLYESYQNLKNELTRQGIIPYTNDEFLNTIRESSFFSIFRNSINNINTSVLYNSETHGVKHNERVSLMAFFLMCKLNIVDGMDLVLDACKYHDIGRENDLEDSKHGLRSAIKLNFLSTTYSKLDLLLLKFIVEGHSLDDSEYHNLLNKYQLNDSKELKKYYNLLKDSDALDRVRINDLDINYLRNEESKKLSLVAYNLYYNYQIMK